MQLTKPLIVFALIFLTAQTVSRAQCDLDIEYSFHQSAASQFSVSLRSSAGAESVTAKLHDLYLGKEVQSRRVSLSNRDEEVFTNVKPSLYTIYVKKDGCEEYRSLGQITGIKIGD